MGQKASKKNLVLIILRILYLNRYIKTPTQHLNRGDQEWKTHVAFSKCCPNKLHLNKLKFSSSSLSFLVIYKLLHVSVTPSLHPAGYPNKFQTNITFSCHTKRHQGNKRVPFRSISQNIVCPPFFRFYCHNVLLDDGKQSFGFPVGHYHQEAVIYSTLFVQTNQKARAGYIMCKKAIKIRLSWMESLDRSYNVPVPTDEVRSLQACFSSGCERHGMYAMGCWQIEQL